MNTLRIILLAILLAVTNRVTCQEYVIDSVCRGAERHYRIDGETGSQFTWILTDPADISITLPETADTVSITWNMDAGDYSLSVLQTSIHGCDSLQLGIISVFDSPLAFAGENVTRCGSSPFVISGANASGYSSLRWISSGDGIFSDDKTLHPTYTFGPNDKLLNTVTLTLTATGFGSNVSCPPMESSITIFFNNEVVPVFNSIGPLCLHSNPPVLPTESTNGITGTWMPSVITTTFAGTRTYTFTPDSMECPVNGILQITVGSDMIPLFAPIGPLCLASAPPLLPVISLDGFTGTWSPDSISTAVAGTTIYTFMSDTGQCAVLLTTLAIEVSSPQILEIQTLTALNGLANGVARIIAGGTAPPFTYSLNGINWQTSNVYDTLRAGNYIAMVKDANGCINTSPFMIQNTKTGDVGILAGNVVSCVKLPISIPVLAYDFTDISSFTIQMAFDSSVLNFSGLTQMNGLLNNGSLTFSLISPGMLKIEFTASDSITLRSEDLLFNLNFYGLASGYSELNWNLMVCKVFSAMGYEIPSIYTKGAVEIRPAPQIYTNGSGEYCEGTPLKLSAGSLTAQSLNFRWINPGGESYSGPELNLGNLDLQASGEYKITATDSTACAKTEILHVLVNPNPVVKISDHEMLCSEQVSVLTPGLGYTDYTWQDGSKNPTLTATYEGMYWVVVTDSNSCKGVDSVLLRPCELLIWMPNAFSPNGDGLNDVFEPKYNLDIDIDFKILVFNKWGEEIFNSNDRNKGWDGTFKGVVCPEDLYTWTMTFTAPPTYNFLQKSPQSGVVMLLK